MSDDRIERLMNHYEEEAVQAIYDERLDLEEVIEVLLNPSDLSRAMMARLGLNHGHIEALKGNFDDFKKWATKEAEYQSLD